MAAPALSPAGGGHGDRVLHRLVDSPAAPSDFSGRGIVSLVAVSLFWLSVMALAAYAVQAGVDRYRDHD